MKRAAISDVISLFIAPQTLNCVLGRKHLYKPTIRAIIVPTSMKAYYERKGIDHGKNFITAAYK